MKGQRGITLIALVITIIVLLILAGVSIAMLTGQNGILTNSTKAKAQNELGTAKDQVALAANEALTNYYTSIYASNNTTGEYTDADVKQAVSDAIDSASVVSTVAKTKVEGDTFTLSCNGWSVTGSIDSKGALTWGEYTNS